jgi:hypothetical protein
LIRHVPALKISGFQRLPKAGAEMNLVLRVTTTSGSLPTPNGPRRTGAQGCRQEGVIQIAKK